MFKVGVRSSAAFRPWSCGVADSFVPLFFYILYREDSHIDSFQIGK